MSSVILAALQKPDAEFVVSKEAGSWIGKTKNKGSRRILAYNLIKKPSKCSKHITDWVTDWFISRRAPGPVPWAQEISPV